MYMRFQDLSPIVTYHVFAVEMAQCLRRPERQS